jgi:hypothetical protein
MAMPLLHLMEKSLLTNPTTTEQEDTRDHTLQQKGQLFERLHAHVKMVPHTTASGLPVPTSITPYALRTSRKTRPRQPKSRHGLDPALHAKTSSRTSAGRTRDARRIQDQLTSMLETLFLTPAPCNTNHMPSSMSPSTTGDVHHRWLST